MIVSKYGKCYDTADGSEQQQPRVSPEVNRRDPAKDRGSVQRWDDDGGAAAGARPATEARSVDKRRSWSVISLRDLLKAIRLGEQPESAAAIGDRADEDNARVRQATVDDAAETARIKRDRYRNAWEGF